MNNSIDQLFLLNNLVLNITGIPKLHGMVVSKYQTFRDERSRHLIKNIKFTQLFTNLNTTFYKIRFYYLKKKVLKEIIGRSYFSKHLLKNMLLYINNFYLYF